MDLPSCAADNGDLLALFDGEREVLDDWLAGSVQLASAPKNVGTGMAYRWYAVMSLKSILP